MVYNGYNKTYDFRKFKVILVFGNEIRKILLICTGQIMSKAIWQILLKNLKLKPSHKIILI